jgi:hypothetical protein
MNREEGDVQPMPSEPAGPNGPGTSAFLVIMAWIAVGIPMIWGVWMTLRKATLLFR